MSKKSLPKILLHIIDFMRMLLMFKYIKPNLFNIATLNLLAYILDISKFRKIGLSVAIFVLREQSLATCISSKNTRCVAKKYTVCENNICSQIKYPAR